MSASKRSSAPNSEQVAREQNKPLAGYDDDLVLLESGLDSLCLAIIVARLEDQFGANPFAASEDVYLPVTLGDFIRFYQRRRGPPESGMVSGPLIAA